MSILLNLVRTFTKHLQLFRRLTGRHIFVLTGLTVVMSYAEGVGIALFFPLLRGQGDQDALSSSLSTVLRALHVPPSPLGALPLIVVVFVLKGLLLFITQAYAGYLTAQVSLRLRREIVAQIGRLDYRAIVDTNTGFLSNLLVNEVAKVGVGFQMFSRVFAPGLNVAVFFGIVLWLDWQLTMLCVLMGAFAALVMRVAGRIAQNASRATVTENTALTSLLIQMTQSFKYLRATAGLGVFEDRIRGSVSRLTHSENRSSAALALSQAVAQPLMVMFLAAIIYAKAGLRGEALGSLYVLLLYFYQIMGELWMLQYCWQVFLGFVGPIELVTKSLESFRRDEEAGGRMEYVGLNDRISVENLSFGFSPDRQVLRDVNLNIPKNASVALVGESGSGKSTLVDLIMGTLKPGQGTISIDGTPLEAFNLETVRRRIGYVPQDAMLFDDTVANNIALWVPARDERVREAAARAKCTDFIDAMPGRLHTQIGDRGVKLSGGQRQRLAIARELFKDPDILVLDEATSALDSESEQAIQQSIDALRGRVTVIVIAHRLSTIRNCELVCVLHDGRIVERGTYDELNAVPDSRFRRMVQRQTLEQESNRIAASA